jgi:hypothetical protein
MQARDQEVEHHIYWRRGGVLQEAAGVVLPALLKLAATLRQHTYATSV